MAGVLMKPSLPFTLLSIILLFPTLLHAKNQLTYAKNLSPNTLGLKKQKLTHFRVYWHDVVGGPNATTVQITPPVNESTSNFGKVNMIDDALTIEPKLNSKLVGRAQGLYAFSAQSELGLMMAMNFAFMEGKYNGSTISILGRNTVFSKVREMPIIGGSGLFRFASGYVQARTHMSDLSHNAIVEYNCYVLHY